MISGTLETLLSKVWFVIIYLVAFTTIGAGLQWLALDFASQSTEENSILGALQLSAGLGVGVMGLAMFLLAVIGQYLLWEAMLGRSSAPSTSDGRRFLAFLVMLIIIGIGTSIGFVLLVIPGFIMLARWSMAPALLIKQRLGVVVALENSWDSIKGNTTPIVFAILVGTAGVMTVSLFGGGAAYFSNSGTDFELLDLIVQQAASELGTVLSVSLGTFLYRRFYDESKEIIEVFS